MLDLIIIGGAAAGSSAAIYSARRKLNFKMITDNVGGEVALSGTVNNWPGIIEIQGFELAKNFNAHVRSYGAEIVEGQRAVSIESKNNFHIVTIKDAKGVETKHETKTVIIATGIHPRRLGVPGEKEFDRQGVTYCTVCDGPLFKNKTTVTVGSGNAALESALMMSGIAKKVYLLSKYSDTPENNGGFPKGETVLVDKVKQMKNVEIVFNAATTEIIGDKKTTGLKYTDASGGEQTIAVDGVMVHVGMTPNSDFAPVAKDRAGQIIVDGKCATDIAGIFAAGDVTNIPYKQIAIASGQGVTAALAAIEYLNRWRE
ncbi:MAG: FAD-dependent oxidoreductase [Candidatus Magasanikbacteria bacterium]|jgi:alkyl hydroperoxide reductase subunit AhpF